MKGDGTSPDEQANGAIIAAFWFLIAFALGLVIGAHLH